MARKLARLTREVEEVKAEYALQQTKEAVSVDKDAGSVIESLGKALDGVRASQRETVSAHSRITKQLSSPTPTRPRKILQPPAVTTVSPPEQDDPQVMAQLAAFESRLTDLERGLGLAALDSDTTSTPLIPTLSNLDKQLSFLASTDAKPYLETLAAETAALRKSEPTPDATAKQPPPETPDMQDPASQQLKALVSLLPTLTSQSEVVPHLLARLSTLRHIHAGAETASETLTELETRQQNTDGEIELWRQGLGKLEVAVRDAESGLKVNVDTVEEWVRELEGRVKAVSV